MQNRTIAELLKLMIENQDCFYLGLCDWPHNMYRVKKIITMSECIILEDYVKANRPSAFSSWDAFKRRNRRLYWPMGDIRPRIKWINQHLNKLTKSQSNESN